MIECEHVFYILNINTLIVNEIKVIINISFD